MAAMKISNGPGGRLQAGAAILAAAKSVDARLIKQRLASFEREQRSYAAAQAKIDAAESQLEAAQTRVAERDLDQDEAIEALVRLLVADGKPRANPLALYGAPAPAALARLSPAEEAKAVRALTALVLRDKSVGKQTVLAAKNLEKAARAVEEAAAPIEKLQAAVREARHSRDALAPSWDSALAALKRGARAATDDGGPHLYAALFQRPAQANGKKSKSNNAKPAAGDASANAA